LGTIRLVDGTTWVDARLRPAPTKLPGWISALLVLSAAAVTAIAVLAALLGLFAALRIAHGYGAVLERAPAVSALASVWPRAGGSGRIAAMTAESRVVARSDPAETELGPQSASGRTGPGSANEAAQPAPAGAPEAEDKPIGGIDRAARAAPAEAGPAALPPQTKPHPAIKRHAVRKRVRRVARRSAFFGATASFTNQSQRTFRSARRAANGTTSPFQPIFNSP
jgi:hypothetical protein